jgi:Icc-related predicted phosphoesterase
MPVYAVADLHGNLPDVPGDCELLLIAGDICPDFRPTKGRHWDVVDRGGQRQRAWLNGEFRAWLDGLADRNIAVVATWGNHDFVGEHPYLVPKDLPWTLLVDQTVVVNGLHIYGTPWVPSLRDWAFYKGVTDLQDRSDRVPDGIDVLMTHGPPYGAGDRIPTRMVGLNHERRVGDETLVSAIERVRPKVVVCGHIHEDRGMHMCGGVPVYNVAAVDAFYDLCRDPFVRVYDLES